VRFVSLGFNEEEGDFGVGEKIRKQTSEEEE